MNKAQFHKPKCIPSCVFTQLAWTPFQPTSTAAGNAIRTLISEMRFVRIDTSRKKTLRQVTGPSRDF